jgi:alkanesulfonate monooxygenase SsuD/methylene tetrahydromethanopterin reductase-like flavin-dependent oxidoreductase (luciferase family)
MVGVTLRDLSYPDALACAQVADSIPIHSLWLPESVGQQDASILLAALAVTTRRCKLGTGVANVYTHNPVQTLMATFTLDSISNGRFILGLGSGNKGQLEKIGAANLDRPLLQVREFIEIVRLGLFHSKFSYTGKIFAIPELVQRNKQTSVNVPVYLAAHNPQMLKLAGSIADGVLLNIISIPELPQAIMLVKDGERDSQYKPDTIIASYIPTFVSDNEREAVHAAKTVLASYCSSPIFLKRLRNFGSQFASTAHTLHQMYLKNGLEAAIDLIDDNTVHQFCIAGNFAHLRQHINVFRQAGLDLPILSIFPVPLRLKQYFPPLADLGLRESVIEILNHIDFT